MFSSSGLLPTVGTKGHRVHARRSHKHSRRKGTVQKLTECIGKAMNLGFRYDPGVDSGGDPDLYGYACSSRCKHPIHLDKGGRSGSRGKSEDLIPEHLYRKYTETDSRPLTPDLVRRSVSLPRGKSLSEERSRRCLTPEPETRQCEFHHRRVLILDLRRVKSVDMIGRQGSRTPGTSIDSTGDDTTTDAALFQFSPRNLSVSRSITPKTPKLRGKGGKKKRAKERSSSPITYERSTSPKILEGLTLPPLHSSVLTLLGGLRSKPSQRGDFMTNHLQGHQGQGTISANPDQTGTTKHKKLRRHGRTRNKNGPATSDQNETASKNRAGSEEVKKVEDPNETQVSTIAAASASTALLEVDADDQAKSPTSPLPFPGDEGLENFIQNMKNFRQSRQALYSVLDDYLSGKVWSPQEMDALDTQIDGISQEFRKLETKFQTQSINLKESTWLSFPRTWSRNSATFFAPNDTKALREMKPLDYLKKYVTVSGPRKHLYSLIFQRYRTMENPTKDWIWIKTLQAAVSEVLGRPFSGDEMVQLCHYYLGEDDWERPISEAEFTGTCAFCERIYAVYSLEDNSECHTCYKTPSRFRHGCHSDQKDHLETADLAYLHTKLRDGLVPPALTHLLLALANQK